MENKRGFLGIDISVKMILVGVLVILALAVLGIVFWPRILELKDFFNLRW